MFARYLLLCCLALGLPLHAAEVAAAPDARVVVLSSLEWPPYTSEALPEQGTLATVARQAFKAMGYTLVIEFYPWSRAVHLARHSPRFHGYFPEYHSATTAAEFIYSKPLGEGPLGFAERTDSNTTWRTLQDLSGVSIGVVQDYINTDEFDRLAAAGVLRTDIATTDERNLLKLAIGHIDLAVIDRNVFDYLISTPALAQVRARLKMNPSLLEHKGLFICFKKGKKGAELARIFNQGLQIVLASQQVKGSKSAR